MHESDGGVTKKRILLNISRALRVQKRKANRGKGINIMAQRKTSAKVAKIASKLLRNPKSSKPVRKVAASDLSQRAPQKRVKK